MQNKNNQKGALTYQFLGWLFLAMFFIAVVSIIYYHQAASVEVDTSFVEHKVNSNAALLEIVDYQTCVNAGYAGAFSDSDTCDLPDGRVFINPNRSSNINTSVKLDDKCPKIITSAKDPLTGEIKTFPTICNVPVGWILIK